MDAQTQVSQMGSISDWKTYTDEKLHITVMYPQDWKVSSDNYNDVYRLDLSNAPEISNKDGSSSKAHNVVEFRAGTSASPCIESSWKAVAEDLTDEAQRCESNGNAHITVGFSAQLESAKPIEEKIVSTLKFTSATQSAFSNSSNPNMSDWKTYTNSQYGFTLQYPSNYGSPFQVTDGVAFGENGNAYMTIHWPKRTFTANNLSFTDYMNRFNVKGYDHAQINVDGISAQSVTSSQIGTMVFVPLADGSVLEVDGSLNDPSFSKTLSTFKFTSATQSASYNSTNPNMSGGLNGDLKTYSNSQYGFSLQYPSDFKVFTDMTSAEQNSAMTYMGTCNKGRGNTVIICYVGNSTTAGFSGATVDVNANTTESASDCGKIQQNENGKSTQPVTVNGLHFAEDIISDAGLGHYLSTDSYRIYNQGICYEISLRVENHAPVGPDDVDPRFLAAMNQKLKLILSTFKFNN
jgi:hypothetical protein